MPQDVRDLTGFYDTPLGQMAHRAIAREIGNFVWNPLATGGEPPRLPGLPTRLTHAPRKSHEGPQAGAAAPEIAERQPRPPCVAPWRAGAADFVRLPRAPGRPSRLRAGPMAKSRARSFRDAGIESRRYRALAMYSPMARALENPPAGAGMEPSLVITPSSERGECSLTL